MTLMAELDEADKTYSKKKTSWFDLLAADAKQELLDIRQQYHEGRWKKMTRSAVAEMIVAHAQRSGWSVVGKKGMIEWLAKRD